MNKSNIIINKDIAECVGLWLAEGDNKSKNEITFTNNCWSLVDYFFRTIKKIFDLDNSRFRVYTYSSDGSKVSIPISKIVKKYYQDKRATKPYFILRLASVNIVKKWKEIVESVMKQSELSLYVLRGFFAGEGNIHSGAHNMRVLRIAQGIKKDFIDKMIQDIGIKKYSFYAPKRYYLIWGKKHWDLFAKYKIADMHPDKKERFWRIYNSFKEEHYSPNYLIKRVYRELDSPSTTRQLSKIYKRSFARLQDIVILLKKQKKINNYRIGSETYWTKNKNEIIISRLKNRYLIFLDRPHLTSEFAKTFEVDWKSSSKRLKELEKLGLVKLGGNRKWIKITTKKKITVI